jgi:hypothetical protein
MHPLIENDSDDKALYSKVYGDPWRSPKDGKQMVDPIKATRRSPK